MEQKGLQKIIGAKAFQKLMKAQWPLQHFISNGHNRRLDALRKIPALQRPELLFKHWPETGRVWSPLKGDHPVMILSADQLSTFYKAGHTIYLSRVERYISDLLSWIRGFERDLNLNRGDISCEILCSIKGQGAKMHFDPNMTFNFQLQGRKTWKIAPNECITNPQAGGALCDEIPLEIRPLLKKPFPKEMPAHAESFETQAGSLVFLPHGCWHSTECSEPSMALLFTIAGNYWHTMLGKEVEAALRNHEICRSMALVPSSGKKPRAQSREQLAASIEILKSWVITLNPDELLKKWSGPPLTRFKKEKSHKGKNSETEIMNWVDRQGGTFHTFDLVEEFSTIPAEEILKKVWKLESKGILKAE